MLGTLSSGQKSLVALRGFNLGGSGRFAGPRDRRARGGRRVPPGLRSRSARGALFRQAVLGRRARTPVAVLAAPVSMRRGERQGVVEALVSWEPILQEFRGEARREVRATLVDRTGTILFPVLAGRSGPAPRLDPRGGFHAVSRPGDPLGTDAPRRRARLDRPRRRAGLGRAARARPRPRLRLGRSDGPRHAASGAPWPSRARFCSVSSSPAVSSQPIARLADSTRAISEGEYGATVEVGGDRRDRRAVGELQPDERSRSATPSSRCSGPRARTASCSSPPSGRSPRRSTPRIPTRAATPSESRATRGASPRRWRSLPKTSRRCASRRCSTTSARSAWTTASSASRPP